MTKVNALITGNVVTIGVADVFRSIGTVPVERLLSEIRVRDVMSVPAISVGLDTKLAEAASLMAQKKLGSLPVADHGRIVGMITETDLLRHIVGAMCYP